MGLPPALRPISRTVTPFSKRRNASTSPGALSHHDGAFVVSVRPRPFALRKMPAHRPRDLAFAIAPSLQKPRNQTAVDYTRLARGRNAVAETPRLPRVGTFCYTPAVLNAPPNGQE
jgi:hypothetical protein